jgi:hypothetical protein
MQIQVLHYKWNRVFKRWDRMRVSHYAWRPAVVLAYDREPFLVQKRQQLHVLPPEHLAVHTDSACASVV